MEIEVATPYPWQQWFHSWRSSLQTPRRRNLFFCTINIVWGIHLWESVLNFIFTLTTYNASAISDKFLREIATLLDFDLPANDIFSRNKVKTLVFTLKRLIVFLEEYGKADKYTLHSFKEKLSAYQNLLFTLKQYSYLDSDDIHWL